MPTIHDPAPPDHPQTEPDPGHRVRISARAKRIALRILADGVVEVVLPVGGDMSVVPRVLAEHRDWITRARARLATRIARKPVPLALPDRVHLRAVGETWRVTYGQSAGRGALSEGAEHLLVHCNPEAPEACHQALRAWARARAQRVLLPQLEQLSRETGLRYAHATVRAQRTRWGSCSQRGTISLNYRLLFLPPDLMHYVLVHELCHIRHLDHSKRFWALVARFCPGYAESRRALRDAALQLPHWTLDTAP
jgi:predicted metal-dependent hydrolase